MPMNRALYHHLCTETRNRTTGTGKHRPVGHKASNITRKYPGVPKKWRFWPCRWERSLCRSSSCAVRPVPFKGHAIPVIGRRSRGRSRNVPTNVVKLGQ